MSDGVPVVLCGIDDSPGARAALEEAVRVAARRRGRVHALLVYEPPEAWSTWNYGPGVAVPVPEPETFRDSAVRAAREIVDPVLDRMRAEMVTVPDVSVDAQPGRPVDVLVDEAAHAEALVVGHRGRGAFASTVMGSTSLGCVLHAPCPVTVVPVPVTA
ncbi:universal stress protein [Actinomycetospora endophytica]|uniref:Universal stress protein n=1 Tax=Actinomycetospora endophytica TaxID=2291215 RepID=A0ABS8PBG0_9PSEU|nr:universal stress protein [Actinomycetospora endophytica]MCD2195262.1 universal stress protein [Actinomycetospora endophytica]